MRRSRLPLRTWKEALFIWTGGTLPSSSAELARRLGVDEGTAQDITRRILKAAKEDIPPLQEPAELAWFELVSNPKFRHRDSGTTAARKAPRIPIALMMGRRSGQTIISEIDGETDEEKQEWFQDFVSQNLAPQQHLYLSKHNLFQKISDVKKHRLPQYEASYLLQDLREQIFTANFMVHNGVSENHVCQYLTGYQWWENHWRLTHRERMRLLARGMMWKTPPASRTQRKRKRRKAESQEVPPVF